MAFRILNHQQMGFSYATFSDPSPLARKNFSDELDRMIEDAIRSAKVTSADSCLDFAPPLKASPSELPIFDESLEGISEKTKIEKAKSLEESARSVDPERIKKVRKASYQEVLSRTTLINSNGLFPRALSYLLSVTAVAENRRF
jgi:predicted Zn-dependent protease